MLVYIEIGRFGEALVELGYDNSTRKLVCLRATNPVADYVIIARLVVGAQ